jgi:hypothetical protein
VALAVQHDYPNGAAPGLGIGGNHSGHGLGEVILTGLQPLL